MRLCVIRIPARAGASLFSTQPEAVALVPRKWNHTSRRAGVVGVKMGMMSLFDHWGQETIVTVVKVDDCQVLQVNHLPDRHGHIKIDVGAVAKPVKTTTKPLLGHFNRIGVEPKRKLASFRISSDAILPPRFQISARHFVPGQFVDVTGMTIGKGFQGPMKRWGFKGLPATHGVSISHRSHGSTGGRQDPGRVWKGKKMAGRMGNERVCVQSLQLYKIDCKRDLLFIKGHIPGYAGNYVLVKDAIRKPFEPDNPPPFPSWFRTSAEDDTVDELVMPHVDFDPFGTDVFA